MKPLTITDVRAVPGDSAFLIDDGTTAILYDSGFAFTGDRVAENIRAKLGARPLDYIFLSHSHYDHVLGSPYVARAWPEAKVVAGAYAERIFQKPSARAVMRELNGKAAREHGATAWEDLIDELKVDIPVEDGDSVVCGDLVFKAVALPGHTKCSVGYYLAEQKLLLGSETLGVYFGVGIYLPSFLVGYQVTLDSFRKAKALELERMLLPHYGVVEGAELRACLEKSEKATVETARRIVDLFRAGKTEEEILAFLTETDYSESVRPTYPIDAFLLNTGIMIGTVRKELLPQSEG